jgi:transposase
LLNALRYVAAPGGQWRGLPKPLGNGHTLSTRLNRCSKSGVLDRVFETRQREQMVRLQGEAIALDSSSGKVHPDGAGAVKKTDHRPAARRAAAGTRTFLWLPQMLARP